MTNPLGSLLSAPPPTQTDAQMLDLAARHFGLTGTLKRLTSERDLNLLLRTADGSGYVLKASNPAEPPPVTEFQTLALKHIAHTAPDLPVPRVMLTQDGSSALPLPAGGVFRVLSYLEGTPLHLAPRSNAQRRAIGAAQAALTRALQNFNHPAADHILLWDIKNAANLRPLLPAIADPGQRATATAFLDRFDAVIAPALAQMPLQVVHSDMNPHNVLVDPANPDHIAGIIDFGDMVRTPRVCDVAVAASYVIDPADPLGSLCAHFAGYQAVNPLTDAEVDLLFDLTTARLVTTLCIANWRAVQYPDNAEYILRNTAHARIGLAAFAGITPATAREAYAAVKGHADAG